MPRRVRGSCGSGRNEIGDSERRGLWPSSTTLRTVMTYITAIQLPIAGLALLPVLFGLPPIP